MISAEANTSNMALIARGLHCYNAYVFIDNVWCSDCSCPSRHTFHIVARSLLARHTYYSQFLVAWHSGRTPVFHRRTFPVLCSTCSWWVTT